MGSDTLLCLFAINHGIKVHIIEAKSNAAYSTNFEIIDWLGKGIQSNIEITIDDFWTYAAVSTYKLDIAAT